MLADVLILAGDEAGTVDQPSSRGLGGEISYTAFDFETTEMADSGKPGDPGHIVYDLAAAKLG